MARNSPRHMKCCDSRSGWEWRHKSDLFFLPTPIETEWVHASEAHWLQASGKDKENCFICIRLLLLSIQVYFEMQKRDYLWIFLLDFHTYDWLLRIDWFAWRITQNLLSSCWVANDVIYGNSSALDSAFS